MRIRLSKIGIFYLLLYAAGLMGIVVSASESPLWVLLLPWSMLFGDIWAGASLIPFVMLNGLVIYMIAAQFDRGYAAEQKSIMFNS
jgi:hypothetical protein